jgi:chorismate dehydratase
VRLLQVLLEKKYGVRARLERLHSGVNDLRRYDAVLLIGDEALRGNKLGLEGFELVYDLAKEWYDWQKLPFVFAVWATTKLMPAETRMSLNQSLQNAVARAEENFERVASLHGKRIGLNGPEIAEYLEGFNYRLGEREREAIRVFRQYLQEIEMAQQSTPSSKGRQS